MNTKMKKKNHFSSYEENLGVKRIDRSWLPHSEITGFTPFKSTADLGDHFEVSVQVPATDANSNISLAVVLLYQVMLYLIFSHQKLINAYRKFLTIYLHAFNSTQNFKIVTKDGSKLSQMGLTTKIDYLLVLSRRIYIPNVFLHESVHVNLCTHFLWCKCLVQSTSFEYFTCLCLKWR
jgi:hypothetical protein